MNDYDGNQYARDLERDRDEWQRLAAQRGEELERANQKIIRAERLLLRASRVVELDDWRDDYDAWMSAAPAPAAKPALRPEFIALGKALTEPLLCFEGDCAKMTGRARPCPVHDAALAGAEAAEGIRKHLESEIRAHRQAHQETSRECASAESCLADAIALLTEAEEGYDDSSEYLRRIRAFLSAAPAQATEHTQPLPGEGVFYPSRRVTARMTPAQTAQTAPPAIPASRKVPEMATHYGFPEHPPELSAAPAQAAESEADVQLLPGLSVVNWSARIAELEGHRDQLGECIARAVAELERGNGPDSWKGALAILKGEAT